MGRFGSSVQIIAFSQQSCSLKAISFLIAKDDALARQWRVTKLDKIFRQQFFSKAHPYPCHLVEGRPAVNLPRDGLTALRLTPTLKCVIGFFFWLKNSVAEKWNDLTQHCS